MSDPSNLHTLAEAARLTGLTVDALRKRIKRGLLEVVKGNDGLVRVRLTTAIMDSLKATEPPPVTGQALDSPPAVPRRSDERDRTIKALEAEAASLREQVTHALADLNVARTSQAAAMAEAATERSRAEEARVRAAAAEGELKGLTAGAAHLHEELARMRREVAEAHNRAVTAEQLVLDAVRQRDGAEQALARARSWNFLNFLFGREGKGRS